MTLPLTLVVTPAYCTPGNQRLPLLRQTIHSVSRQNAPYLHVIVDDGSTDETPELLERLARQDPSLRVVHQTNQGSSAAVNAGIERALTCYDPEYVTVLHSDDLLLPGSLESRVSNAQQRQAVWVYTDRVLFMKQEDPPHVYLHLPLRHQKNFTLRSCLIIAFLAQPCSGTLAFFSTT